MAPQQLTETRQKLQDLIQLSEAGSLSLQERNLQILAMNTSLGASVEVLDSGDASPVNCLAYALGFSEIDEYLKIARRIGVFANSEFLTWLLNSGHLREVWGAELVLYFADASWTHAGVARGSGRVVSKWNAFGLFVHGLWEVPVSYGNISKSFQRPSVADAYRWFQDFAETKGVQFDS